MLRILLSLFILCFHLCKGQELSTTVTSLENASLPPESLHTVPTQNDHSEDGPDKPNDVSITEIVLETSSGTNIPKDPKVKNKIYHNIPVDIFQKFSTINWWQPVQDRVEKLKEFLAYTKHPNYGGVQYLNPQDIWEKIHEKGHHLLTGVHGAVFGLANVENHDYPFAYRDLKRSQP